MKAILSGCDLKEAHLTASVIQSRYQEVHRAVHWMKLRVLHRREAKLRQQLPNKPDIPARIVPILNEPLYERRSRECATTSV